MQLHALKRGQGQPILCLHGHPGSARTMAVFAEGLGDRYYTLAPDLRGYGKSQTPQPFDLEDSLADVVELLDREAVGRCLVLGWSLGGILALELALRYPDRVAGLILVASAARPVGAHPPIDWLDLATTGVGSLANLAVPGHPWVRAVMRRRSLYRYLLRQHSPQAYDRLAREGFWAYVNTSPLAHRALNRALARRYNRLPDLAQIAVPCLVLCGAEDCHITAAASLETAAHLPQATSICYPNTAHLLPWEIPEQMLSDIRRWLDQHFAYPGETMAGSPTSLA